MNYAKLITIPLATPTDKQYKIKDENYGVTTFRIISSFYRGCLINVKCSYHFLTICKHIFISIVSNITLHCVTDNEYIDRYIIVFKVNIKS